jgi:hypothetical protein
MANRPPWLLWGNQLPIVVPLSNSIAPTFYETSQIVDVRYGRPDSFHFLFAATINSVPEPTVSARAHIYWDLTLGVGRSRSIIRGFEEYLFTWTTDPIGLTKWSTEVNSPVRIDGTATSAGVCRQVVAETIVLGARASVELVGEGSLTNPAYLTLSAAFAPICHVRPEWHEGVFDGDENAT